MPKDLGVYHLGTGVFRIDILCKDADRQMVLQLATVIINTVDYGKTKRLQI